jgi:fumarylpyruvate hydrolase
MNYAIPLWDAPCVPIAGTKDVFPVRHIYCVGRNYAEHAKEMGGDATKEPPFFFCKPADAVFPVVPPAVGSVRYPLATKNLHHEIELVVAIGKRGVQLRAEDADALVFGYATGLDMTRRDLQNDMREKKRPWDIGKSFAQAAPIGAIHAAREFGHPERGAIWVDVNGVRRQTGDLAEMIWSVPEIIVELGRLFALQPGDLIFTGTPSGVGPVARGDRLHAQIAGVGLLDVDVV